MTALRLLLIASAIVIYAPTRGIALGVLSVPMGGLFTFPYLVHAAYVATGDATRFVLGRQPA